MTAAAVRRLEPRRPFSWHGLVETWRARELLYFFVWRDVAVRYKQTVLGVAWAVLQPLLAMVVFTLFFGRLAKMPSDGAPYWLFSLAALVPWTYFATAIAAGGHSLVGQQHVISKVYFPRLLVPLASVVGPLVDFVAAFVILLAMMIATGHRPLTAALALPAFLALAVAAAAAGALWLSALTVRYRDLRYVLPFLVQVWMFATPVVYPASIVPGPYRVLYGLNPMAGVVEGFRWGLVGGPAPGLMTVASAAVVLVALVSGTLYFRHVEGTLVDTL